MAVVKQYNPSLKKFYLPSTAALPEEEQAYVIVDVSPMVTGDILNPDLQDTDNVNLRLAKLLVARITEWNLTLENGTPLPVNLDSLKLLQREDFQYLCRQPFATPGETLGDEQKKS